MSGDAGGDCEQAVADAFRFPPARLVLGVGEEPGPGEQVAGEGDDRAPDAVLGEPLEGQVAQPGVFRLPDAVLAAGGRR